MMQSVLKCMLKLLSVFVFFISSQQSAQANVSLITDTNGILFGANGIVVDDFIYNVRFQDGSWPDLGLSVIFSTEPPGPSQIERASKALIDNVFTGIYDTNPALTNGCSESTGCLILTPRLTFFNGSVTRAVANVAFNSSGIDGDTFDTTFQLNYTGDTTFAPQITWAVWTQVGPVTPIPEPSSLMMLVAGLGLLLTARGKASSH